MWYYYFIGGFHMKFRFEKTSDREEVVAYGKTKTDLIMLIDLS